MLVLSRKAGQRIVIGDNIELIVVALSGDRVKLGINAPSEVQIHREEVHQRIQSENGKKRALPPEGLGKTIVDDRGASRGDHRGDSLPATAALVEAEIVLADLRKSEER